jgi:hypothetical protein
VKHGDPVFEILRATSAFSALNQFEPSTHRRDAEIAETTLRKTEIKALPKNRSPVEIESANHRCDDGCEDGDLPKQRIGSPTRCFGI